MFTLNYEFMKKRKSQATGKGQFIASLRGSLVKMTAFVAVCMFTMGAVFAQTQTITGVVTEADGATPIAGANVIDKGNPLNGTITGANGEFSLPRITPGATLEVSFIGYNPIEVSAVANQRMSIRLAQSAQQIQGLVVMGYGSEVAKETLTGAVSSISAADITTTQSSSLAQALQGKVAGFSIRQDTGQPGSTDAQINVRGFGTPIFVIDGVKRGGATDFHRLNPNDIESISLLKDASAAIYGLDAANGVVIVTTKKGQEGRPRISYRGSYGIMQPTDYPRMAYAWEYAEMRNDALLDRQNNPGDMPFTQAAIDGYKDKSTQSTNWFHEALRKWATQTSHDISVSGGNADTRYFISASYLRETTILKSKDEKFERYTFRSNLTTKIGKNVSADFRFSGRYDKRSTPGRDWGDTMKGSIVALPTMLPYANNNPEYPGNPTVDNHNPVVTSQKKWSGYTDRYVKRFESSASLTWDIPWVKGLKATGLAAYDSNGGVDVSLSRKIQYWNYSDAAGYTKASTNGTDQISNSWSDSNNITMRAQLAYANTFAGQHNVSASVIYEQNRGLSRSANLYRQWDDIFTGNPLIGQADQTNVGTGGSESENRIMSYIGRAHYDYKGKYILDASIRYDGSYRYAPGVRWGVFPSVSAGWRISDESFIRNNVSWLNNLKLRASWGVSGMNTGNAFQWIPAFSKSGGGRFEFVNGTMTEGASAPSIVNPDITWVKAEIIDFGIDIGLLNKIEIEFDVYQRTSRGALTTRVGAFPNTFGASLPQENLNSSRVRGFDMGVSYNNRWGDWSFRVSGNLMFARTMDLHRERAPYSSSWDKWKNGNTDRWTDMSWGYGLNGRFSDWEDIRTYVPQNNATYANTGTGVQLGELPGSYKLYDLDGNGVVNADDRKPMYWSGQPKFSWGLNFTVGWKGIDLYMLFEGKAKYTFIYTGGDAYGVQFEFNGNLPAYYYDRWHLKDPSQGVYNGEWVSGKWPALRHKDYHSGRTRLYERWSDVWARPANYLRFKNVELGYTLPKRITSNWKIDNVRFYFQAANIFTICDSWVRLFDPEKTLNSAGFQYPLMKNFNIGVQVTF